MSPFGKNKVPNTKYMTKILNENILIVDFSKKIIEININLRKSSKCLFFRKIFFTS